MHPKVQPQVITNSQETEIVVPVVKIHNQMSHVLAFAVGFRRTGDVTTHILNKYSIFYAILHDIPTERTEINNDPFSVLIQECIAFYYQPSPCPMRLAVCSQFQL
jgi:hypothetical protein